MALNNPQNSIRAAMHLVESDKRNTIRLDANGGNSILIVCEPIRENEYIDAIKSIMPQDKYRIINLNELLIAFVSENKMYVEEGFELLKGSVQQIFKAPEGEDAPDLFRMILAEIKACFQDNKIPILIHSGALYGSGIDNIHIMENDLVMKAPWPLIILYPATREHDKLLFLGSRPSSKYRCVIID